MEVLFFGSLIDETSISNIQVDTVSDTNELIQILCKRYPGLGSVKYFIAVNEKMVQGNTALNLNDTVALMPPFSGG
ncbi:MAG: MoaD/ThiS family protein [Chitinophagaceae bacterium]|nr:MoaD/ThiS family protein [Chitinophagaceae bacterium]